MINPRFEKEAFKKDVEQNVKQLFRKTVDEASQQELYQAVSYVVKDAIIDDWIATQKQYEKDDPKIVYYMAMRLTAVVSATVMVCSSRRSKMAIRKKDRITG